MDRLLYRGYGNFVRKGSRPSPARGGTRWQGSIEGAAQPGRQATQGSDVVPEVARDYRQRYCRTIRLSTADSNSTLSALGRRQLSGDDRPRQEVASLQVERYLRSHHRRNRVIVG